MSSLGVTAIFAIFVVGRFLIRELRERKYVIARIYLAPGLLALVAIALVALTIVDEPHALAVLVASCGAALLIGGGIGYAVAHFTTVRVTADPNVIYSRGSYATVAIWIAALALRLLVRVGPGMRHGPHASLGPNAALIVLLASALFFVRFRLVVAAKRERALGITTAVSAN
jgi:hypothetical protein